MPRECQVSLLLMLFMLVNNHKYYVNNVSTDDVKVFKMFA